MFISFTIFCLALSFAIVGSLTFWPVTSGVMFYVPIVLFIAGYIFGIALWWILLYIFGIFVNQKKEHPKPSKWSRFWLREGITYINFLARISTKVSNRGLVPTNERFLFVCNHRSNFDPMITCEYFGKQDIAFITKPSNFKIPLGHRFMWGLGYLPIDRDDPLQSLETVQKAIKRIEMNYTSIGVYPEGTRHIDGKLGDFHEGLFNIALKAKVPIVVATICGTEHIHKNAPIFKTRVKLDIIKVIPYDEFYSKTPKAISDEIREMIDLHLKEIEVKHE